ncbi:hypothetical protein M758_10G134300 [Ceratodon purpureus]|nr:hypothetical protein M758_10G134300 [Ceratodon purpureus]
MHKDGTSLGLGRSVLSPRKHIQTSRHRHSPCPCCADLILNALATPPRYRLLLLRLLWLLGYRGSTTGITGVGARLERSGLEVHGTMRAIIQWNERLIISQLVRVGCCGGYNSDVIVTEGRDPVGLD